MNTKLIVGCIGGLGALGGAVAGSVYLLKPETIRDLEHALLKEGAKALTDNDSSSWTTLVTKYLGNNLNGITKINVEGGSLTSSSNDNNAANISKLKNACKELLKKTQDYENDKEVAKNWCTDKSSLLTTG